MTCMQCRGTMKRGAAPFHVDRKGYHLLFDAVPSWVCPQCGEVLLEEAEVDAIQQALPETQWVEGARSSPPR